MFPTLPHSWLGHARLVSNQMQKLSNAYLLHDRGVDVMIQRIYKMSSCHKASLVTKILFQAKDHTSESCLLILRSRFVVQTLEVETL